MKQILRLFIFGLLTISTASANGIIQLSLPDFEDVVVHFEQSNCGENEEAIFFNAFKATYPFNTLNRNASYESGDLLCVRAYAYIMVSEGLFKKILLGLALIQKDYDQKSLYVEYLCVDPTWQKRGVGKTILEALENHFKPKAIRLFSVSSALNFYKKLGFEHEQKFSNNMIKRL